MTAKEILTRPKRLKAEIRADMDNLIALRAMAESCTSHLETACGSHSQGQRGGLEGIIIRLAEEEKRVNESLSLLAETEKEAMELIRELKNPNDRAILMTRYIQERAWPDVAKKSFMGRTTALAHHRKALQELDETLRLRKAEKGAA